MRIGTKLVVGILLTLPAIAQTAQPVSVPEPKVFVVRHGEKISETADALSDLGKQRAKCLEETLKDADIGTIITSDAHRTQETAAPLAEKRHVTPVVLPANDTKKISDRAYAEVPGGASRGGNVLIVGHSNTIPQILNALTKKEIQWPATEYDDLYVIDRGEIVHLHYCPAPPSRSDMKMMK